MSRGGIEKCKSWARKNGEGGGRGGEGKGRKSTYGSGGDAFILRLEANLLQGTNALVDKVLGLVDDTYASRNKKSGEEGEFQKVPKLLQKVARALKSSPHTPIHRHTGTHTLSLWD